MADSGFPDIFWRLAALRLSDITFLGGMVDLRLNVVYYNKREAVFAKED